MKRLKKGLVQVYTGEGKGKTTAALGLALRAVGHGFRVYMIQFMKGWPHYGELSSAKLLAPHFTLKQFGRAEFVNKKNPAPIDIDEAQRALKHAQEVVAQDLCDILILDEANCALDFGLISEEQLVEFINSKPAHLELVLTGRGATAKIIALADLVTDTKMIKHYYNEKIGAREGIEY